MKIRKYNGITEKKDGNITMHSFDICEALDQENKRNVFLNGQLYVEMFCDGIINSYFCGDDGLKQTSLLKFLKSRNIDFFGKIELMKLFYKVEETGNSKRRVALIPKEIITSLIAIAEVRNASQHNLTNSGILEQVKKGSKFSFANKLLKNYLSIDELLKDFKNEAVDIYLKLHEILMEMRKTKNL